MLKEISGWPGYRVSENGVVKSCRDNAGLVTSDWKPRNPSLDADGYLRLRLHNPNRSIFVGVHFLVLTMFGQPRPPGKSMALHRDGNPRNNHISNLYWGFGIDNAKDRESHGRTASGEKGGRAKLRWSQVDLIRESYATGNHSFQSLAVMYGVNKKTILNIVHLRTWVRGRDNLVTQ